MDSRVPNYRGGVIVKSGSLSAACVKWIMCPSWVMVLSEVVAWTLHDSFRGQIVIRCVWRGLGINQIYEINQPLSRWDWVFCSCRGGNSG